MNKMLAVLFDDDASADAGMRALRALHREGLLTIYSMALIERSADGRVVVKEGVDHGAVGVPIGLAVGALVGLLGGPIGLALGAVTGTVAGAILDYWVAAVDLEFIEEAELLLQPGKRAVVAEVEEEWVLAVNAALEASGGMVLRRARSAVFQTLFERDIAALQGELGELEAEAATASGVALSKLQARVVGARVALSRVVQRGRQKAEAIEHETAAKATLLTEQLQHLTGNSRAAVAARLESLSRQSRTL